MSTIGRVLQTGLQWLWDGLLLIVETVWGVVLLALDGLVSVLIALIGAVGGLIVSLFGLLLNVLLLALPDMPEADHSGISSGISSLAAANAYVPIAEALALLPVIGAIAGGIGVYKVVKLIRGGG